MSIGVPKINLKKSFCFLISGKAGVGKSFTASLLKSILISTGYKVDIFPFAYGVKNTASFMGWDGSKAQRGRKLLQVIGKAGRDYDEDLWVRSTFNRVEESVAYPYDAIIVDDWRFINEVEYIFSDQPLYKPVTLRILSDEREILRGTSEYNDVSEIGLDYYGFDYHFYNEEDGNSFLHTWLVGLLQEQIKLNS